MLERGQTGIECEVVKHRPYRQGNHVYNAYFFE